MTGCLVFDVNETLLDLAALDAPFAEAFGDAAARRRWFALVLRNAMAGTVIGRYREFGEVAAVSLDRLAEAEGVDLAEADRRRILGGMRALPPHPEVPEALARLRAAGFRCAALTNSAPAVADAQIAHAGLAPLFEAVLSADAARRLKPDAAVYREAARALGVPPDGMGGMWMVAAHDWDVAGAMAAGCRGALITRGGPGANPLFPAPDLVAGDLGALAAALSGDAAPDDRP